LRQSGQHEVFNAAAKNLRSDVGDVFPGDIQAYSGGVSIVTT